MLIQKLVSGARRRLAQIAAVVLAAGAMTVMPAQAQLSRLIPVDGVTSFETQVQFDGRQNRVLYIRPVANPVGRVPAMVVLHYAGGDPEEMANLIAISQLVRDTGIWAVIPDALGRTWSFDPVRDRRKADDVGLITTIIDGTVAAYPIDSRRVWMFGFSAGGFMTMRYVCERPNRIAAVADDAAPDGVVDVIGFSLGAVVAAAYAAREPRRIRRLVLLAGWPSSADARLQLGIRLWLDLHQSDPAAFVRLATTLAFSPGFLSTIGEAGVAELLRWQPSSGIRRQLELDLVVDLRAELPKIVAPTLVIGCRQDQLVPVENARALHQAIVGSDYLELECGHMAGIEQPEALVAALRGFLFD